MNKFVKFPLVLGIVGVICTGALSLVYEVTKDTIAYNNNKEAIDKMSAIVPNISNAEGVLENYDTEKASKKRIQNIYEVSDSSGVIGYGYLTQAYGFNDGLNFIVVLSSEEEKILGLQIVSHNETPDIGGVLLKDPNFIAQFKDMPFDAIYTDVDGKAGATTSLNGVVSGLEGVISYHKTEILGETEVNDGVDLTGGERKALGLPEGYTMVNKTEDFKTTLKSKVSDNMYKKIMEKENFSIINYIDILDASGTVKGHAYIATGRYNCEVDHGNRAWQEHKFVFIFDENNANTKVVVVKSTDSLAAAGLQSLNKLQWLENFNGKTVSELNDALLNSEIDNIAGASYTTPYFKGDVSTVVDAHMRAYVR